MIAALPPDTRDAIYPVVLAASTYDIHHQSAIHEAVRTILGRGGYDANRRIGARAAKIDFGGVYRVFVLAASYERLLGGADRAFRQYNSQGYVTWPILRRGEARGHVGGVVGYTDAMWHALAGRLETLLLLGGARSAQVRLTSSAADHAELEAQWS